MGRVSTMPLLKSYMLAYGSKTLMTDFAEMPTGVSGMKGMTIADMRSRQITTKEMTPAVTWLLQSDETKRPMARRAADVRKTPRYPEIASDTSNDPYLLTRIAWAAVGRRTSPGHRGCSRKRRGLDGAAGFR